MLDINRIRSSEKEVKAALAKRGLEINFTELIELDDARKKVIFDRQCDQ